MKKETYESTVLVVTEFDVEDVITTSVIDETVAPGDNEGSIII